MGEWIEYDDYIPKSPEEIRYNRWKGGVKRKKRATAKLFGGCCQGGVNKGECGEPYNHSFTFHHLTYRPDEKTYKDFDNTWAYNEYVIPIVRSRPEDFMLLCKRCHRLEERIKVVSAACVGMYDDDEFIRDHVYLECDCFDYIP